MRFVAALAAGVVGAAAIPTAEATFPFRPGDDPYDYTKWHIENGSCAVARDQPRPPGSDLPSNLDCRTDWKLSDYAAQPGDADYDPVVAENPQEFHGAKGPGTNRAWEVTTGRPDTVIAVLDSGIRWDEQRPNLVNKYFLNRGELPVPAGTAKGGAYRDYDVNVDGVVNVRDYAGDARAVDHPDDANTLLDPSDLIRTFSDGVDDDGNGYVDDISGWDFFEGDNDANDDVDYGHGTGESEDSAGETETNLDPQCPNCMLLELRVGDSFIADVNRFAEAVVYATDNGASVVQEALGTLNHSAFAQAAVDYAYERGVLVVASEADESAGHHNYPAALNRTMVVNSITKFVDGAQNPKTYLAFNGCTNFGGYTWLSIPSTSCSSDATGQSAGMAGLLYSAARNAVDNGVIAPGPAGRPISAEEAKQLFRASADDIDFSTPKPPGPPNNFATTLPDSQRFVTTAGWDQITGWGRVNTNNLVRLVQAGAIPPEADITSPRWWQPLRTSGIVDVVGRVAAPRASSFTYRVEFAPGVQPPRWPSSDAWTTVGTGVGVAPIEGVLAKINLTQVRAAITVSPPPYTAADDPTSRDLPEKDAFRIRVVVSDDRADTPDAIAQHQAFSFDDPNRMTGFPRFLGADGASSPAFEDLDGDGTDEIVVGDSNGFVHAFKANGTEAVGWPVRTTRVPLPIRGTNGYATGGVPADVRAPVLLGSPTIADVDSDGTPEVAATDIEGHLHLWDHRGRTVAGFPVRGNPAFSEEPGCQLAIGPACDDYASVDVRDRINRVGRSFTASPSAGDLDSSYPGLELLAGSADGHVYAFHADGTPVDGWPVLLRDPAKVAAVDPVTHRVSFVAGANQRMGRMVITTPTVGDVDGDGDLEVAVNVNEEYEEPPNWFGARDPSLEVLRAINPPGNTRTYLLHHDGRAHPSTATHDGTAHPDDQAYVDGWPVKIGMIVLELLPVVGEGSNGAPVMADVDGDGVREIATASIAGPPYLLRADGSSYYGTGPDGSYLTMASSAAEFKSGATDGPSFASLGGGVFGRLGGSSSPLSFAMGSTGLKRLLDVVLPEQQLGTEDHIGSWTARTGSFDAGFPAQMNDLMFFNTPAVADVDGTGGAEILQSSAMYDLRAYGAGGTVTAGWPKFTGGWGVSTAAVGDIDGNGTREIATVTREGYLYVWRTGATDCGPSEWPKYQHDLANTGAYGTDARRPGAARAMTATWLSSGKVQVKWRAPGDDGACGTAARYEVRVDGVDYTGPVPAPASGGTRQTLNIPDRLHAITEVSIRAVDERGQTGFWRTVRVGALPAG